MQIFYQYCMGHVASIDSLSTGSFNDCVGHRPSDQPSGPTGEQEKMFVVLSQ